MIRATSLLPATTVRAPTTMGGMHTRCSQVPETDERMVPARRGAGVGVEVVVPATAYRAPMTTWALEKGIERGIIWVTPNRSSLLSSPAASAGTMMKGLKGGGNEGCIHTAFFILYTTATLAFGARQAAVTSSNSRFIHLRMAHMPPLLRPFVSSRLHQSPIIVRASLVDPLSPLNNAV
jgi:hypothetical protein